MVVWAAAWAVVELLLDSYRQKALFVSAYFSHFTLKAVTPE